MGTVIDFVKAYEAQRGNKLCPLPPPATFYCWTCESEARYYMAGGIQTCALCHFPEVRLTENPPMLRLSGAKDPTAPLWLPLREKPCDREIVAWLCREIILQWDLCYSPAHHPAPEPNGPSTSDFHRLFHADRPEDRELIGCALQSLLEEKWAYCLGRGVAGDPSRYYLRRESCGEESGRGGRVASAGKVIPPAPAGTEQRRRANIE